MKLNTYRAQIRGVADAWREQYAGLRPDIQAGLDALDKETASDKDVAAIIGNDAWVREYQCIECGQRGWQTVTFGEDAFGKDATVCVSCMTGAYNRWMHEG